MKGIFRSIQIIMLTAIMATSGIVLSSCGKKEEVDRNRTQLYVSNYNGGFGDEWLRKAIAKFEETYKDVSYEPGKKGVQVMVANAKLATHELQTTMLSGRNEVFFTENVYYYDYLAKDLLLDITDVLTEPLNEFGEENTIEGKLTAQQKEFYNTDGKYYGIPHYSGYFGISYDKDLFDRYGLYFARNADNGNDGFIIPNVDTEKSLGRDGIEGTDDDGLPVTYDDFFKLCDQMVSRNIKPFVWTGLYSDIYLEGMMQALYADYEGVSQVNLGYSFDGSEAVNLVESISNGSVNKKQPLSVTANNGYEIYAQAGKYYAFKFMEQLLSKTEYRHDLAFNSTFGHLDAQDEFLLSSKRSGAQRIGMIIDGCWWMNEAKGTFSHMVDTYGDSVSAKNRNIGYMPLPIADSSASKDITLFDTLYSLCFVKSNIQEFKIPIAKNFLRFVNTDESLKEFTLLTNSPKALNYSLSQDEQKQLTPYGASLYNIWSKANIVYPFSSSPIYTDNQSKFAYGDSFQSKIGGNIYSRPIQALRNGKKAEKLFFGVKNFFEQDWTDNFKSYFTKV